MAVSALIDETGADPSLVRRVACRFRGMVTLPNELRIAFTGANCAVVGFTVQTQDGTRAIDRGAVVLAPDHAGPP